MNEKEIVKKLKESFENANYDKLSKIFVHTNLATKGFHEIWKEWWEHSSPPALEVDMIFTFREYQKHDIFMPAVEVKYFRETDLRDFREGIQQALSLALFGFDSLVLWHIFPEDATKEQIESITKPCKELINSLRLPIVYFSTRIKENKFEIFSPWEWGSSVDVLPYQFISYLKEECEKSTNPILSDQEVQKRRRMLKVLLKIPV